MKTNTNYADFTYPAEAILAFDTSMTGSETNSTVLPVADPALVKRLAKMGEKTESFARRAIALGRLNPDLLPKGLDLDQAEKALANRDLLLSRYLRAKQLADRFEAAMILLGADAYNAGLAAYKSMKVNGRDHSLLDALRELGRTFRKQSAAADDEEPTSESGGAAPASPAGA